MSFAFSFLTNSRNIEARTQLINVEPALKKILKYLLKDQFIAPE